MFDSCNLTQLVRRKKRAYQVLGGTLTLGLILGWFFLVIEPLRIEREQLLDQQAVEKQLIERKPQILQTREQAHLKLAQWQAQDDTRIERSAAKLDSAGFLSWVNGRSEAVGLEIRDFRPSGREIQPDYQGHCVALSGQGSFESICLFLDELRRCPRMNRITSVEIVPRDEERSSYLLSLGVVLYTYRPQQPGAKP